jgi:hypothetical protein
MSLLAPLNFSNLWILLFIPRLGQRFIVTVFLQTGAAQACAAKHRVFCVANFTAHSIRGPLMVAR